MNDSSLDQFLFFLPALRRLPLIVNLSCAWWETTCVSVSGCNQRRKRPFNIWKHWSSSQKSSLLIARYSLFVCRCVILEAGGAVVSFCRIFHEAVELWQTAQFCYHKQRHRYQSSKKILIQTRLLDSNPHLKMPWNKTIKICFRYFIRHDAISKVNYAHHQYHMTDVSHCFIYTVLWTFLLFCNFTVLTFINPGLILLIDT